VDSILVGLTARFYYRRLPRGAPSSVFMRLQVLITYNHHTTRLFNFLSALLFATCHGLHVLKVTGLLFNPLPTLLHQDKLGTYCFKRLLYYRPVIMDLSVIERLHCVWNLNCVPYCNRYINRTHIIRTIVICVYIRYNNVIIFHL